jgi:PHD/YefM family antitoxin component YafN of YafNO toxin-antitoxin module
MNKNKRKQIKTLTQTQKPDNINAAMDLAKKHGTIQVKHKKENFILMTDQKYNEMMEKTKELQDSLISMLNTIDSSTLPSREASVKQVDQAIDEHIRGKKN